MSDPLNHWRPPSFLNIFGSDPKRKLTDNERDGYKELDLAIKISYENDYLIANDYLASTNTGLRLASGTSTFVGSITEVNTQLNTVVYVVATVRSNVASNRYVTYDLSTTAGRISLFAWQPTAAGDTTPIAATASVIVGWMAFGT